MGDPMAFQDWTSAEHVANLACEELDSAMKLLGVDCIGVWPDDDSQKVNIAFRDIQDAATVVSLGITADQTPGSLYDRVSSSCVTVDALTRRGAGQEPTQQELDDALDAGWSWRVHPDMVGRRMDWHVSVDMPTADAVQLTANLNLMRKINP